MKENEKVYTTKEAKKDILLDLAPYVIILIFVFLTRTFIAAPIRVNGSSMSPTLSNGNIMILYKLSKHTRGIRRFDIVVANGDNTKLIKRVIGLPGDKIEYKVEKDKNEKEVGKLYVNGKYEEEFFLSEQAKLNTCGGNFDLCEEEFIVPADSYFLMGDNRGNSLDSRMLGFIKEKDIDGITSLVIYPFNKIGNVK